MEQNLRIQNIQIKQFNLLEEANILTKKLQSGELDNLAKLIDNNKKLSHFTDYNPLILSDLKGNPIVMKGKRKLTYK